MAHVANAILDFLKQYYDNWIISRKLLFLCSPDVTPPDDYLFRKSKTGIHRDELHNLCRWNATDHNNSSVLTTILQISTIL